MVLHFLFHEKGEWGCEIWMATSILDSCLPMLHLERLPVNRDPVPRKHYSEGSASVLPPTLTYKKKFHNNKFRCFIMKN